MVIQDQRLRNTIQSFMRDDRRLSLDDATEQATVWLERLDERLNRELAPENPVPTGVSPLLVSEEKFDAAMAAADFGHLRLGENRARKKCGCEYCGD